MPHRATGKENHKVRGKEEESKAQARGKGEQQEGQREWIQKTGGSIEKHGGEISAEGAWKARIRRRPRRETQTRHWV